MNRAKSAQSGNLFEALDTVKGYITTLKYGVIPVVSISCGYVYCKVGEQKIAFLADKVVFCDNQQ